LQEIYIIDDKTELIHQVKEIFKNEKDYHFVSMRSDELDTVLNNIPTMIIIDDDNNSVNAIDICKEIRKKKNF